jgi:tetratricopeptide (TPR) repeat protein
VYRNGDRVRVNAQLIDANTDAHLWAETYDRAADDLFAVQREISLAVARQLRIKLSSADARDLAASLTSNPRAYELYILARKRAQDADLPRAIEEFSAAVALDPLFAEAFAQRSITRTRLAHHSPWSVPGLVDLAEADAERALELDPALPAGHFAKAVFYYRGKQDIERAASEFELAAAGLPNDADVHVQFGWLRRWQGRLDEALALFQRAAELDPMGDGVSEAVGILVALDRRVEANALLEAAQRVAPDSTWLLLTRAEIAGRVDCDLGEAERAMNEAVSRAPDSDWLRHNRRLVAINAGDYETALRISDWLLARPGGAEWELNFERAVTLLGVGRTEEGRSLLARSRDNLLRRAAEHADSGGAGNELSSAALTSALLGDRPRTIEYVDRSIALMSTLGA